MPAWDDDWNDEPPVDLWFKVTGMLAQNWATVVEVSRLDRSEPPTARIDFFDDHGEVFDALTYPSVAQAEHALGFNGFTPLSEQPGFQAVAGLPRFPLRYRMPLSRPVYSSGEYWHEPPDIGQVTQRRPRTPAGLQRFVAAQADVMETVLAELRDGRKRTHWMWFVFPQISGLGHSAQSERYGIVDIAEARRYLNHPVLGPRLQQCFELVLQHRELSAERIFGELDARKFRSCATLFNIACGSDDSVFAQALRVFFGGKPDRLTQELL